MSFWWIKTNIQLFYICLCLLMNKWILLSHLFCWYTKQTLEKIAVNTYSVLYSVAHFRDKQWLEFLWQFFHCENFGSIGKGQNFRWHKIIAFFTQIFQELSPDFRGRSTMKDSPQGAMDNIRSLPSSRALHLEFHSLSVFKH